MSEWRGLHNPELHTPWTITVSGHEWSDCTNCGPCAEYYHCRCCLAAEVQLLRAQVQAVRSENERLQRLNRRRLPPTDYSGMTG